MAYNTYSPGTAAIMRSLFGGNRGTINPMNYDAERMNNAGIMYGNQLMRGTGNPNNTTSGAVRDAGEKITGSILSGWLGKGYNDKEKQANEQWSDIIGGDSIEDMQARAGSYGGNIDPKVSSQIGHLTMLDKLDKPYRDLQQKEFEYRAGRDERRDMQWDMDYKLRRGQADMARNKKDIVYITDEYGVKNPYWKTHGSDALVPVNIQGIRNGGSPFPDTPAQADPSQVQPPQQEGGQQPKNFLQLLWDNVTRGEQGQGQIGQRSSPRQAVSPGVVLDGSGRAVQVPSNVPWGKQEKRYIDGKEYYGQSTPNGAFFKVGGEVPLSAAERKDQKEIEKMSRAEGQARINSTLVTQDIDRALELANGWTTGASGYLLSAVPGTDARDMSKLIDGIKARIGFNELQEMRANSPTGGALGSVSDTENILLQSVRGSLDQSQSKEQLVHTLKRARMIFDRIVHKGIPDDEAVQLLKDFETERKSRNLSNNPYANTSDEELLRGL